MAKIGALPGGGNRAIGGVPAEATQKLVAAAAAGLVEFHHRWNGPLANTDRADRFGFDQTDADLLVAQDCRDCSGCHPSCGAAADVRAIPFRDDSFDAIYSMGTIEHFDETERAVEEMVRVLKPGGCAIVGVPNRHDRQPNNPNRY